MAHFLPARFKIPRIKNEQPHTYSGAGSGSGPVSLDSSQPPSESATVIAGHKYLLTQILIKLPPKALLRFQCVSKIWLSLISDPTFLRLWCTIRKGPTFSLLFFPMGVRDIGVISLGSEGVVSPSLFNSDPLKGFIKNDVDVSTHCCNGLWCLQIGQLTGRISIVVCNPTTWKHRVIPVPVNRRGPMLRYSNIAFDPLNSDHYKLVCVGIDRMEFRFMVYSSESADWRVTEDEIGNVTMTSYYFENGIFWNGDLHFIGLDVMEGICSICFDVEHERIRSPMPRIPGCCRHWDLYNISYFGEAGGDLCLVCVNNPELSYFKFDIFALKRDYSEWTLKYRVDFAPLIATYPDIGRFGFCTSNFIVRAEKTMMLISLNGRLVSCDISNMEVHELVETVGGWDDYTWNHVFQHVECLALV